MKVLQPLSFVLIVSWLYCGNGFHHFVGQRNERMTKLSLRKSLTLEKLQLTDGSSHNKTYDRYAATRRTWCRNVIIAISTVATTGVTVGQRTTAMETPSLSAGTEQEDPLVKFGENLSSRKSNGESNTALPISSSASASGPGAPTMARPTGTDPIVVPSTSQEVESSQPSALEQVLQQSKLKKQINPTTHG